MCIPATAENFRADAAHYYEGRAKVQGAGRKKAFRGKGLSFGNESARRIGTGTKRRMIRVKNIFKYSRKGAGAQRFLRSRTLISL